jgi:hypothetical protein
MHFVTPTDPVSPCPISAMLTTVPTVKLRGGPRLQAQATQLSSHLPSYPVAKFFFFGKLFRDA